MSFKVSDRVIRLDGRERGREAEIVYLYNEEQMEIRYCDNPERTYDVKSKHYALALEWARGRHSPYKPRESRINWAKIFISEETFDLNGHRYVAPMSWLTPQLLNLLVDKGFLKKIGRLSSLFCIISDWGSWFSGEIQKKKIGHPFHYNCIVYEILKDINQLARP